MEVDASRLERGLLKAHETLINVLEKRLPGSSSFFTAVMKLVFDDEGASLVIDVYARRRNTMNLEHILEEAIDEARRVFEVEAGIRVRSRLRIKHKGFEESSNSVS